MEHGNVRFIKVEDIEINDPDDGNESRDTDQNDRLQCNRSNRNREHRTQQSRHRQNVKLDTLQREDAFQENDIAQGQEVYVDRRYARNHE
jgi:hypothetical protein